MHFSTLLSKALVIDISHSAAIGMNVTVNIVNNVEVILKIGYQKKMLSDYMRD